LGAFAGLRSAEVERLDWTDIKLDAKSVVVGASRAKTAARRVVPMLDCLCEWLAPYAGRQGQIWAGGHDAFYEAQQDTASKAGIKWKANALRHSFASYRFAQTGDAGRVAGELGNSASVVHKHYRELVTPAAAAQYFDIKPAPAVNVVAMPSQAVA
jgi:integrase